MIVGGVRSDKEDYLNSLKLNKRVKFRRKYNFTGSQSKIEQIYALSDVVISSSKNQKVLEEQLLEAICMNKPVDCHKSWWSKRYNYRKC